MNSNATSTLTGSGADPKGKKKGLPAKNLMAERRRRKKLNDRLYMLRSVVPKISKIEVRLREGRAVNIHMFCGSLVVYHERSRWCCRFRQVEFGVINNVGRRARLHLRLLSPL